MQLTIRLHLHNHIHNYQNHLQTALINEMHDPDAWQHSDKYGIHVNNDMI